MTDHTANLRTPTTESSFSQKTIKVWELPSRFQKERETEEVSYEKGRFDVRIKKGEWPKSRQTWIGLDGLGNDIPKTLVDLEMYDNPVFSYHLNQLIQMAHSVILKGKQYQYHLNRNLICLLFIILNLHHNIIIFYLEQPNSACSNPADRKTIFLAVKIRELTNHRDILQTMKISRTDHLMNYGKRLLLQDSTQIEA